MHDLFRTLAGVVKDIDSAEALRDAVVFATWRRIAGEPLSEHAVPVRLDDRTLVVAVSNLTWQRHLQDLAGQMLFKLNASLGNPLVKFIEFRIDDAAVAERRGRRVDSAAELNERALKELTPDLRQAATAIADERLRKEFLAAAGLCLASRTRK